jgi:hypothetical protein
MTGVDLDRVRHEHQVRSLRFAALLRVGVVGIMVGAMLVGTPHAEWAKQSVLLAVYGFAALWAVVVACSPAGPFVMSQRLQFVIAIADVAKCRVSSCCPRVGSFRCW